MLGFFFVSRQILWNNRWFKDQVHAANPVTGALKTRGRMGKVTVRSIKGVLELPDIDVTPNGAIDATERAWIKDAAPCWFPVEYTDDGVLSLATSAADETTPLARLLGLVGDALKSIDTANSNLGPEPEVLLPLKTLYDGRAENGLTEYDFEYVFGTEGGERFRGEESLNPNSRRVANYDGWDFGFKQLEGWTVQVLKKPKTTGQSVEHLVYSFFPPSEYFFKPESGASYKKFEKICYTTVPDTALALADAWENAADDDENAAKRDAVMKVFSDTKDPAIVERLRRHIRGEKIVGRRLRVWWEDDEAW